ncbi:MAG: HAMP domain-containing sensor histidine kinase [bacterium]|nr:HAMP domain-containing sensor histidine kinase [bacterium]
MLNLGQTCSDASSALWGIFDFSIAPPLLFYAYIPIIIISLFFGIFVMVKDKYSSRSKLLFYIALVFSGLLLNEITTWIAAPVSIVQFGWEIVEFFRILVPILTIYFVYEFIDKDGFSFGKKLFLGLIYLTTILLIPTTLNIGSFDLNNCESIPGQLWDFTHVFEVIAMLWIVGITVKSSLKASLSKNEKYRDMFLGGGAMLFLFIFFSASMWGDLTKVYDVGLVGPVGMLIFMTFLAFIIVRYHAFNIKLIGAQALIVSLVILIGSEFFFIQSTTNQILTAITLVITGVIGLNLIRSVKKEVAQREHIEKLAGELQETNKRQETLMHFIGHEVKGYLTKDAGAFAAIVDGDFGAPPDGMKPFAERALAQSREGALSVENLLTASNQKNGKVSYTKEPFDLKALAEMEVERTRPTAEAKGLALSFSAGDTGSPYILNGDKGKIGDNLFRNVIDNAINYTPTGSVAISLKKENLPDGKAGGKFIFAVKDTGIGIDDEDKKNFFTEGGHGKDSQKMNIHSTGYGLFIAKNIAEAHGGTIRAESEGEGKGSTFIVELPV